MRSAALARPCASRACYFLLFAQDKVTKEKGTRVARRTKDARLAAQLALPLSMAMLKQCSRKPSGGAAVLGEFERGLYAKPALSVEIAARLGVATPRMVFYGIQNRYFGVACINMDGKHV